MVSTPSKAFTGCSLCHADADLTELEAAGGAVATAPQGHAALALLDGVHPDIGAVGLTAEGEIELLIVRLHKVGQQMEGRPCGWQAAGFGRLSKSAGKIVYLTENSGEAVYAGKWMKHMGSILLRKSEGGDYDGKAMHL